MKRSIVISTVNVDSNGEPISSNLNLVAGKTQIYSNCVTLSSSLPLFKMTQSNSNPNESDISIENSFHSDDIIEDEMEIEELLEQNISVDCPQPKDLFDCVTKTEYSMDDIDDTSAENTSFIGEADLNCDNVNTLLDDRLTNYVEVIETNDETDDEQQSDLNVLLYENFSRKDLIDELVAAKRRINELETKLDDIQNIHLSMIQNLNNFNKVMIS